MDEWKDKPRYRFVIIYLQYCEETFCEDETIWNQQAQLCVEGNGKSLIIKTTDNGSALIKAEPLKQPINLYNTANFSL